MTEKFKYLKIISFAAVILAIILALSAIVDPANTRAGVDKFDKVVIDASKEDENSMDVVVLGDSEAYRSIIPPEMYEKYGFTTYVGASPSQKTYQSCDMLEALLERQKPKVCILEPNVLFINYSLISSVLPKMEKKFPIFKYHNAWKGLVDSDYEYEEVTFSSFKGYRYTDDIKAAKKTDYMMKTDRKELISSTNLSDFNKICDICEKNNIELLIVRTPSIKTWDYAKYDAVRTLTEEKDITYIDLNLDDPLGIDWSKDTYDKGDHLNHYGAVKVTEYLGEYLHKNYDLPDHRNDDNFSSWDKMVKKYQKKVG